MFGAHNIGKQREQHTIRNDMIHAFLKHFFSIIRVSYAASWFFEPSCNNIEVKLDRFPNQECKITCLKAHIIHRLLWAS